jgi:hypothetical protein
VLFVKRNQVWTFLQGVLASSGQVLVQDELHAVDGVKVHRLLPEKVLGLCSFSYLVAAAYAEPNDGTAALQVTALVKGAPDTSVRLSVHTPKLREV